MINETSLAHSAQKAEISKSVGVDANFDGVQSFSFNVVTLFSFPQLSVCFTRQIYSYANLSLRILKFSFKSANIGCETPLKMQNPGLVNCAGLGCDLTKLMKQSIQIY